MTLTYIFHSGFVLETEQSILVFDYWLDPSGIMDGVLRGEKPMYVFSSHFHEDHFTKEIFEWKKQREGITYILSKDIYKHRRASKEDADVWLAKGGAWSDDTISVWALGSTDSGVSWIVETEGKRIFHAGDLNNWYAKFLTDDNPDQERYSFEVEEVFNPIAHEKQFLGRAYNSTDIYEQNKRYEKSDGYHPVDACGHMPLTLRGCWPTTFLHNKGKISFCIKKETY